MFLSNKNVRLLQVLKCVLYVADFLQSRMISLLQSQERIYPSRKNDNQVHDCCSSISRTEVCSFVYIKNSPSNAPTKNDFFTICSSVVQLERITRIVAPLFQTLLNDFQALRMRLEMPSIDCRRLIILQRAICRPMDTITPLDVRTLVPCL